MSKKADVWMPIYIGDYLADTAMLSTEQHGAYLLMLMAYWKNGPLPDDDEILANITRLPIDRWKKTRGLLLGFFSVIGGFLINRRADEEKEKADAFLAKQRSNGAKGGRPPKPKNPNETQNKPMGSVWLNPNETPSPSPSQLKEGKNIRTPKADAFGVLQILETFPTLDESVANDFLKHRKAKRAPLTQSAWDAISREIMASGWTPDKALRETMARGWQSFKADWVAEKPQRFGSKTAPEDISNWVPASMRGTPDDPLFDGDYIDAIQ